MQGPYLNPFAKLDCPVLSCVCASVQARAFVCGCVNACVCKITTDRNQLIIMGLHFSQIHLRRRTGCHFLLYLNYTRKIQIVDNIKCGRVECFLSSGH